VILTFFKEGIGNNLTMPSGSWVWVLNLGSWKWVLGQGLLVLAESLLIYFGLVFVKWGTVLNLLYTKQTPWSEEKPFVYWIRFEKLFLVSFLLVFVN
jgi:hypothetical protein